MFKVGHSWQSYVIDAVIMIVHMNQVVSGLNIFVEHVFCFILTIDHLYTHNYSWTPLIKFLTSQLLNVLDEVCHYLESVRDFFLIKIYLNSIDFLPTSTKLTHKWLWYHLWWSNTLVTLTVLCLVTPNFLSHFSSVKYANLYTQHYLCIFVHM